MYAGFTSSTGGASSDHYISKWYIDNEFEPCGIDPATTYAEAPTQLQLTETGSGTTRTLTANVKSSTNTDVPGITVTFTKESGTGTLGSATQTTDGSGNATVTLSQNGSGLNAIRASISTGAYGVDTAVFVPVTQASNMAFGSVGPNRLAASWTRGSGDSVSVFVKLTSSAETPAPVNGTNYTANATFGNGSQIGSSGWYCVYNGTGTSVNLNGFSYGGNSAYRFMAVERNSTGSHATYLTSTVGTNPKNQTMASSYQATSVTFSSVTPTSVTASWTRGTGDSVAVFVAAASSGAPTTAEGTTYTANTTFGSGTAAGAGWYCVYNGSGTSVTITGLTTGTTYRVMAVDYEVNGSPTCYYYSATATGNPANVVAQYSTPTVQDSAMALSGNAGATAMTLTWARGNGTSCALFVEAGAGGAPTPSDGSTYTANPVYGLGTLSNGWSCVYNGTGTTVTVTGLTANTLYTIMGVECNGSGGSTKYLTTLSIPGNTANIYTGPVQATALSSSGITTSGATLSWTRGGSASSRCAVFVSLGSSGLPAPAFGTQYYSNINFGDGAQIGSSGWYCVYDGTGTSVAVTGLTAGNSYRAVVCEYNGGSGSWNYNTSGTGTNVVNFAPIPYSGSGTKVAPYLIATLSDLQFLSENSSYWGFHFKQTASINAGATSTWNSGAGFSPIGNSTTQFTGSYNGQGYVIDSLAISRAGTSYVGLFGYINYSTMDTIQNLNLTNVSISGGVRTGSLIGSTNNTCIVNCSSTGAVTANGGSSGGLVGDINGGGKIIRSLSTASLTVGANGNAGGLTGYLGTSGVIQDCYARGSVSSSGSGIGGLVGQARGTITCCYATGAVTGSSSYGGLVGTQSALVCTKSFWDATTSGQSSSAAGTSKTTALMKSGETYTDSTWDFACETTNGTNDYWRLNGADNNGYPTLSWQGYTNGFQKITFGTLSAKHVGDAAFNPGATSCSGLTVSYGSSNLSVATVSGSTVTIVGAGSTNITASQAGSGATAAAADVQQTLTVYAAVPATQATAVITSGGTTSLPLTWTRGSGDSVLVFMAAASSGTPSPVDGADYAANAAFTSGAQIGTSGWYCVYKGTGTGITVTGLTAATTYRVMAVERNGGGVTCTYVTATASGNPANLATIQLTGSGTKADPYLVPDLATLGYVSETSSLWNKHFKQTADISAGSTSTWNSGAGFSPIGNSTTQFTGSYNGQGYTIDSLTISRSGTTSVGLFGYTNPSSSDTLQNVIMTHVLISGQGVTAALVGYAANTIILNCSSSGAIATTDAKVGGLVGDLVTNSKIVRSFSTASISGSSNAVGGLIGFLEAGCFIQDCYARGSVTGGGMIGGLVGSADRATITNCYSTGAVTASNIKGGLVGWYSNTMWCTGSFWDTTTSGQSSSALGSGKSTAQMKSGMTYVNAGWDLAGESNNGTNDFWRLRSTDNSGYPTLDWQGSINGFQYITWNYSTTLSSTYGDPKFALLATVSSGLTPSYASSDTNVAKISGDSVTVRHPGTATITISQPGNGTYEAAANVLVTLNVQKATAPVTTWPTASSVVEGQTLANSTLSGGVGGIPGTFSWYDPSTVVNYGGGGAMGQSVAFTPTDTQDYAANLHSILVMGNYPQTPNVFSQPVVDGNGKTANPPAFKWNKVDNAIGYRFQLATVADFASKVIDTVVVDTFFSPAVLTYDAKYFWRVQTVYSSTTGPWTGTDSVSITPPTPTTTPSNPVPPVVDANGKTSTTPTFKWNKMAGATKYHFELAVNSGYSPLTIDTVVADTLFTSAALSYDTKYYWRVAAVNTAGTGPWGSTDSLTTTPSTPTTQPSNPVPPVVDANGKTSTTPTFKWNKMAGATKYHFELAVNSGYSPLAIDTVVADTFFTSVALSYDTKYYWRVAAVNTAGTGPWSSGDSVTTTPPTPTTQPSNPVPPVVDANGKTSTTPIFKWNKIVGATKYHFELAANSGYSPLVVDTVVTDTFFTSAALSNDTKYYWRVAAVNTAGTGPWTNTDSLTTTPLVVPTTPPSNPVPPVTDANGKTSTTPIFRWNKMISATKYRFELATNSGYNPTTIDTVVADTFFTSSALSYDTKYYWRVSGVNGAGTGPWTTSDSIVTTPATPTTTPANPIPPVLDANGKTSTTPIFRWNKIVGATKYHFELAANSGYSPLVVDTVVADTFFTSAALSNDTKYYWRIAAVNTAGTGPWTNTDSLTTTPLVVPTTPPSNPVPPVVDANGKTTTTPTFRWNKMISATKYRFELATNSGYSPLTIDTVVVDTFFTSSALSYDTKYYWRVSGVTSAGPGPWSAGDSIVTTPSTPTTTPSNPVPPVVDANGKTSTTPTFKWNKMAGATKYHFELAVNSGYSPLAIDTVVADTFFTSVALSYDTKYYWRVAAVNTAGTGPWSASDSVTTTPPTPTTTPSNPVPPVVDANGKTANPPHFVWGKIAGATKYRFELALNSGYSPAAIDTMVSDTFFTPAALSFDAKYYWRVAAVNTAGTGPFSPSDSVTTTPPMPTNPPASVIPPVVDASGKVSNTPTFVWNKVAGASGYRFQLSTSAGYSPLAIDTVITDTSFTSPKLSFGTTYFWHVAALNSDGKGPWTATDTIVTAPPKPVDPPVIKNPLAVNAAGKTANPPHFVWGKIAGASGYRFELAETSGFSPLAIDTVVADTFFTPQTLSYSATYYWRVAAVNADGLGPWSAADTVATVEHPPVAKPVVATRISDSVKVGTSVTLAWDTLPSVTKYRIQVSRDSGFVPARIDTVVTDLTAFVAQNLGADSTWYWRIAAVNDGGNGPWSDTKKFTTLPADPTAKAITTTVITDSVTNLISSIKLKTNGDTTLINRVVTVTQKKDTLASSMGMTQASSVIDFSSSPGAKRGDSAELVFIIPDTLPDGTRLTAADKAKIFIYEIDSTGALRAVYSAAVDPVSGTITMKASLTGRYVLAIDTVKPEIADSTPAAASAAGSSPVIKGKITDNVANLKAWVYFRKGGAAGYDSLPLALSADGSFELPLSSVALDQDGFEYFIGAFDGVNRTVMSRKDIPVRVAAVADTALFPSMQWHLFAVPLTLTKSGIPNVLTNMGVYGKDWKLFERALTGTADSFVEYGPNLTTIGTGASYWLKTRRKDLRFVADSGVTTPVSRCFTITIPAKTWAALGDPYLFPVGWQAILDSSRVDAARLIGPYTYRDSAWVPPTDLDHLDPWEGYYVYNGGDSAVTLQIPSLRYQAKLTKLAKAAATPGFVKLDWSVSSVTGRDYRNYFGFATGAGDGYDAALDCPKPGAPEQNGPSTWFTRSGFGKIAPRFQTDFTSAKNGGAAWNTVVGGLSKGTAYLCSAAEAKALPDSLLCVLVDLHAGVTHDLKKGAYSFSALEGEGERPFAIVVGSKAFADGYVKSIRMPPQTLILSRICPNPIRRMAIIRYALPWSATGTAVKLDIYNLQGRLVTTLVNRMENYGLHTVTWDLGNTGRAQVATGVYFLRLVAGKQHMFTRLQVMR